MNNITRFLELYKSFEHWAKDKYPIEHMADLEFSDFGLNNYRSKLRLYRNLRNILSHNVIIYEEGKSSSIAITNRLIAEFKAFVADLQSPVTSISLDIADVYKQTMNDNVSKAIHYMSERDYSHIPIMADGRIVGVFSENTLFKMFCKGDTTITPDICFKDLSEYIAINETYDASYGFITETLSVPEVLSIFQVAKNCNHRLDILFITDDGTSRGLLKGIVTAWDMAAV